MPHNNTYLEVGWQKLRVEITPRATRESTLIVLEFKVIIQFYGLEPMIPWSDLTTLIHHTTEVVQQLWERLLRGMNTQSP